MAEHTKRQLARERRARRKELKAPRSCFWSWPWGHLWDITGRFEATCTYCGKRSCLP
jgi:hypothetical protein